MPDVLAVDLEIYTIGCMMEMGILYILWIRH